MHRRLLFVAVLLVPGCANAQAAAASRRAGADYACTAPVGDTPASTLWEVDSHIRPIAASKVPISDLVARLQGRYRLLIVNTEGYADKAIADWDLRISATSAASIALPFVGDAPGVTYLLTGTMRLDSAFTLPSRMRRDEKIEDVTQGVAFDRSRGILWLRGRPLKSGADNGSFGRIYRIGADGTLTGRWEWPSSGDEAIPTPFGPLREHVAGYFCAFKTE